MIADLNELPWEDQRQYDVVIVGSGPAGMTLARELADTTLRVGVLESGQEQPTPRGDGLRRVASEGIHIKEYSRERVLGGASSTWSGLSSPLDDVDLLPRPYLRQSGWPLNRAQLEGLYREASTRYRFPDLELFEAGGFDQLLDAGERRPNWDLIEEKVFLAAADAQHFGREGLTSFERKGLDLFLDATVVGLEQVDDRIVSATVQTRGGSKVPFSARVFILAAGGIENARLLLDADIGNQHDQVGRYMMNHPKNYSGILHLSTPIQELPYYFGCQSGPNAGYAGLRLKSAIQQDRGLLNAYVRLEPLFAWSDNEGIETLVLFAKKFKSIMTVMRRKSERSVIAMRDYSETGDDTELSNTRRSNWETAGLALRIVAHLPSVLMYLFFRLTKRAPKIRRVRIRNFMEMEPQPDNRVVLDDQQDANGRPRARVLHESSERDRNSLIALHEALQAEFTRTGLGSLDTDLAQVRQWPITQDASHHMGTTRMGHDPESSVVTPECRVHGVQNLYCAGASVFPTSGCANPTYTIVALSIRLARQLRADLLEFEP